MANDFLTQACAFIEATVRAMLLATFILCFLGAIITLWGLAAVDQYLVYYTSSYIYTSVLKYCYYIDMICSVPLFVFGTFAAYTGKPKYLKWLALFVAVSGVMTLSVHSAIYAHYDWDVEKDKFSERMRLYARDYQFDLAPYEDPNVATKAWDLLQEGLSCCGIYSKSDWNTTGPNGSHQDTSGRLPKSCCLQVPTSVSETSCSFSDPYVYKTGCLREIEEYLPTSLAESIWNFIVNLLVAAAAVLLAKRNSRDYIVEAEAQQQKLQLSI